MDEAIVADVVTRPARYLGLIGSLTKWRRFRDRLEARGTAVIRLEPGPRARRAMGLWAMAEDRAPRVVEAAYEETRSRILSNPALATLVARGPASAAG